MEPERGRAGRRIVEELPGVLIVAAGAAVVALVITKSAASAPVSSDVIADAMESPPRRFFAEATSLIVAAAGVGMWVVLIWRAVVGRFLLAFPDVLSQNWRRELTPVVKLHNGGPPLVALPAAWGGWGATVAMSGFIVMIYACGAAVVTMAGAESPGVRFSVEIATRLAWLAWVLVLMGMRYGMRLSGLFGRAGSVFSEAAWGLKGYLLGTPLVLVAAGLGEALRLHLGAEQQWHRALPPLAESGWGTRVLIIALACLVAPVVEEVLFRRIVHSTLRRRMSFMPAAVISSALFAAVHMDPWKAPALFVLGMMLSWVYESRRGLLAPIIYHAIHNTLAVVMLLSILKGV